jgi:hypothetical protein
MEDWELDFEWLRVQHRIKEAMKKEKLPDLNTVLFLIGIQELGRWKKDFTKEEKQDLLHVAVCRLLEYDGFYTFQGRDADGWPHYQQSAEMPLISTAEQERLLKLHAVTYFRELELDA